MHNQYGDIVVVALQVEVVDVFRNDVAIDDGRAELEVVVIARKLLGIHLTQFGNGVLLQLTGKHTTIHLCHGLIDHVRGRQESATLTDAGTEQALGKGRGTEHMTTHGASRLAKDGDFSGVATKVLDITLYPLQGEDLVKNAVVARMAVSLLGEFGMGKESQCTGTILDRHSDDASAGKALPQVATIVLRAEATTMDEHHDGQTLSDTFGRGNDAEIEAVFAHHVVLDIALLGLWGPLSHILSFQHALPRLGGLWCLPAQVAQRGCCIGNGFIHGEVLSVEDTLYITCFHLRFQQGLNVLCVACRHSGKE